MKNILNITISSFADGRSIIPVPVNLLEWITRQDHMARPQVELIRDTPCKATRSELKKKLPAITPSGTFSQRNKQALTEHSGLLQFDIDYTGNEHIGNFIDLKKQISKLVNVAFVGVSVSGNGYWGLVPISQPDKHESHYKALEQGFNRLGITIDPACKDVCRLRFYSFDPEPYINLNAKAFTGLWQPPQAERQNRNYNTLNCKPLEVAAKMIRDAKDGEKHHTLNKAGFLLGGYIASGIVSENEARQTLQSAIANKDNISDMAAAFKTIGKALKDGQNKPIQ